MAFCGSNPKSSEDLSLMSVDCGSNFDSIKHFMYCKAKYVLG